MKFLQSYTVRGNIDPAEGPKYIQLFDGLFTTGFRVVRFVVSPQDIDNTGGNTYAAKLMTVDSGDRTEWDWSDNREIAWAATSYDANGIVPEGIRVIDPDNMIIEDLYLYGKIPSALRMNYLIEFEKYDISDGRGAMSMVRNQ